MAGQDDDTGGRTMKQRRWISFWLLVVMAGSLFTAGCRDKQNDHDGHGKAQDAVKSQYHCPMHPTYVSDKPGNCPICGMKLVPIESTEAPVTTAMPDRAVVTIPPEREQLIGVRTAPVEKKDLSISVRASGRIAYDPDLYNTIVEYREAIKTRGKTKESPWPDVHERSDALVKSSVLRLRQMGLSQDQINRLGRTGEDPVNLLLSQKGGSVWAYAQIYEYESGLVQSGQTMEVSSPAIPGRAFKGRVVAVDTILNPETRTLKVRGEISNPEGLLKPEMFVDVAIQVDLGRKLAIPEDALLDSGTRKLVFVAKGQGQYEPREVKLGYEAEGYYEVLGGVSEGELVITSANFLIDSESKLKSALSGAAGEHKHGQ